MLLNALISKWTSAFARLDCTSTGDNQSFLMQGELQVLGPNPEADEAGTDLTRNWHPCHLGSQKHISKGTWFEIIPSASLVKSGCNKINSTLPEFQEGLAAGPLPITFSLGYGTKTEPVNTSLTNNSLYLLGKLKWASYSMHLFETARLMQWREIKIQILRHFWFKKWYLLFPLNNSKL